MDATDASMCVERGVDALVVSNHGGRQLDGARCVINRIYVFLKIGFVCACVCYNAHRMTHASQLTESRLQLLHITHRKGQQNTMLDHIHAIRQISVMHMTKSPYIHVSVRSSITSLRTIVDAVGGDIEIHMDGGIRSGQDILRALSLGTQGVYIGRPYLYGLGAGGQAGVEHALDIMHKEMSLSMALCGETDIKDMGLHNLDRVPSDFLGPHQNTQQNN